MAVVSHNTELMRNWSDSLTENTNNYDDLVNRLFFLIDQFVGSADFRGGLSTDFEEVVVSKKPEFQKYAETFRECAELINKTSVKIDNDEAELKSMANSANPLG